MKSGPASTPRREHVAFAITAAVCVLAFAWMISFGTFALIADDTFGNFYDHQAVAWLHGRWDVPEPALSGEAFVVNGKVYGYFGPTPALMRLPLVVIGVGFGRVTRLFMMLDYAACLAAAYALLRLAVRWRDANTTPRPFAIVLLTATVGFGSTLFFLGSRAYVYHEAILCGAAFALWSTYGALRYLQSATSRWWIGGLICGVLAVQARPPIGLFALSLLGMISLWHAFDAGRGRRPRREEIDQRSGGGRRPRPTVIAGLAALGIFSFNAVSYIKFGTFEGCPLRYNVQYTPEKLAALGNANFHLGNLRFNTDAYLLRPSFSLQPHFPYIFREYLDRRRYPESRMAYRDQTTAMPWSMPGLFALATLGSVIAGTAAPILRRPLAVLWLSAIPLTLAMLSAVAVTQRYTADFLAFLVAAAAFALAGFDALASRFRAAVLTIATALALLGIAVTLAFTIHHQREIVWGVPDSVRQEYQRWCRQVDAVFGSVHRR